ncbi:MAG: hypothetical protein HY553_22140 [Elusimicrobia bacterium]|nr:hypothetical protein [Elusimicrobiota bacterium]
MRAYRILAALLAAWSPSAPVMAQTYTGVVAPVAGGAVSGSVGAAGGASIGPTTGPGSAGALTLPAAVVGANVPVVVASPGNAGPKAQRLSQPAAGASVIAASQGQTATPATRAAIAGTVAGQSVATSHAVAASAAGKAVSGNPDLGSDPQAVANIYEDGIKASKSALGTAGEVEAPEASADTKAPLILGLRKGDHKVQKPIVVKKKDGTLHPLSYDPAAPKVGLVKSVWNAVTNIPNKIRLIRRYMKRVDELVNVAITDENLWWSVSRLKTVSTQEGILRASNSLLVNQWDSGSSLKHASPSDFRESSLNTDSRIRLFKRAMDLEEPTLQYQYAFAQNLHNLLHTMSHFLGWTFQERLLLAALKDKSAPRSIWATEELRHGPVLEAAYNMSRDHDRPPLYQQGEAPRLPQVTSKPYLALSGMANRSLAELAAGSAYLTIKANAVKDSPTDRALDGIYRDEVYHYVIMSMVNKFAMKQESRWTRLYRIFRHDLDYRPPPPNDTVIHKRAFGSPLMAFEVAYALFAIDKRIDRFLKLLPVETAMELIGPHYLTTQALDEAVAKGNLIPTKHFRMEQNPDLTRDEVETLAKRFPAWFDASERNVKASDIREVLTTYRTHRLTKPEYWAKRKGFERKPNSPSGAVVIERPLSAAEGTALRLEFMAPGREPVVTIVDYAGAGTALWQADMSNLSLLQVGALMDAEKWEGLAQALEAKKKDLSYEELLRKLNRTVPYQQNPLPLVQD